MLVSSFFRGSRQYGVNAPGDFSSSQGGGCWLRGLACLLACLLAFVCVCAFDAAMSLLLSCLGAATRADLGQTLRVTVTFKNNLPLSRKDRQCICHFLRLSIPFALCKPSMQLSPKGKKIKIYMCQHTYLYLYFSLWHVHAVTTRGKRMRTHATFGIASLTLFHRRRCRTYLQAAKKEKE